MQFRSIHKSIICVGQRLFYLIIEILYFVSESHTVSGHLKISCFLTKQSILFFTEVKYIFLNQNAVDAGEGHEGDCQVNSVNHFQKRNRGIFTPDLKQKKHKNKSLQWNNLTFLSFFSYNSNLEHFVFMTWWMMSKTERK